MASTLDKLQELLKDDYYTHFHYYFSTEVQNLKNMNCSKTIMENR